MNATLLADATAALHQQDFARAGQLFGRLLSLMPDDPAALLGQAHVEWAYGNLLPALDYTNRAHRQAPDNLTVYELYSALLAQLNFTSQALEWTEKGLACHPGAPNLLGNLALLHYLAENYPAALATYRQLLEQKPDDATITHMIASLSGSNPPAASAAFVRQHFNAYTDFEEKLTGKLGYRTPAELVALTLPHLPAGIPLDIADLGCGTGLCGQELLRHLTPHSLTGVDLAETLLQQAAPRGYTSLIATDLTDWLSSTPPCSQHLLLAADVLIYLGDLTVLFTQAVRVLHPGGLCAFSIEHLPDNAAARDYFLQPSSRYAHHPADLQRLAHQHGFHLLARQDTTLRQDRNQPVPGQLYLLQKIHNR